ncbi:GNAT family N-acetyltransferase [Chromatiaceae bacterium AAb-1]|nr:GNAT family N-acetyltransferase [Chromatiaceae bacterium AAb-1]
MSDAIIQHQPELQRFVLMMDDAEAVLEYEMSGQQINFTHTFVPPEFRGKGLAEKLVRNALSWAKSQNYQIVASCSYVQKFLA